MNGIRLPHLNAVNLAGRLTRDPELRYTQSGIPVFNARVAANSFFRTADGEWKRETAYVGVVAWQGLAERCFENLRKGSAVLVAGRLASSEWETEKGERRSSLEIRADRIQFLDRPQPGEEEAEGSEGAGAEAEEGEGAVRG
jgi:single-strand DNA-binding protein